MNKKGLLGSKRPMGLPMAQQKKGTRNRKYVFNDFRDLLRIKIPQEIENITEQTQYFYSAYSFVAKKTQEFILNKTNVTGESRKILYAYCSLLDVHRSHIMRSMHHRKYRNKNTKNSPGTVMWLLSCNCFYLAKELWDKKKLYARWNRLWEENVKYWKQWNILIGPMYREIMGVDDLINIDLMTFQFLMHTTTLNMSVFDIRNISSEHHNNTKKEVPANRWVQLLMEMCTIFAMESMTNKRMNCKRWITVNENSNKPEKKFKVNAQFLNETEAHIFTAIQLIMRISQFKRREWNETNIKREIYRVVAICCEKGRKARDPRIDEQLITWGELKNKPDLVHRINAHISKGLPGSTTYIERYQTWIKKQVAAFNNNQQLKSIMCSFIRHEFVTIGRMEQYYMETQREENIKLFTKKYMTIIDKDVLAGKIGPEHVMRNTRSRAENSNIYDLYVHTTQEAASVKANKRPYSHVYHSLIPDAIVFAVIEQFVMTNFNQVWSKNFYVDPTNFNVDFGRYMHGKFLNREYIMTGKPIVLCIQPGHYGVFFKETLWNVGSFTQALYVWIYLVHSAFKGRVIGFDFREAITKVIFSDNIFSLGH